MKGRTALFRAVRREVLVRLEGRSSRRSFSRFTAHRSGQALGAEPDFTLVSAREGERCLVGLKSKILFKILGRYFLELLA